MNTERRVIGVVLLCIGLLLVAPFIPKFAILFFGIYFIIWGMRLIKGDSNRHF